MAGLINTHENTILDELLGSTTHFASPVYVGLMTAAPDDDGTGVTEPSSGAYARVAVDNNDTEWPDATLGQKSNANDIVFPTATGDWGEITYFGIFETLSGDDLIMFGALNTARDVLTGDTFRFMAGSLDVELD
jgi:hypothetical protein